MALPMTRPWKHPKTGVFWLRKRVPDDLRLALGKREEKRSLGTKSAAEAKIRIVQELTHLEQRWANLRKGHRKISEAEAHSLAEPVCQEWIAHYRDNPSQQKSWDTNIIIGDYWGPGPGTRNIAYGRIPAMQAYTHKRACELLEQAGHQLDFSNVDVVAFAVAAAVQRACITLERIGRGELVEGTRPFGGGGTRPNGNAVPLEQLVDEWVLERKPAAKTKYEWSRVIRELKSFLGHDDASRVTSSDLNRWKAKLLSDGLLPKTIRDAKLAPVRAVLACAADNERISQNPAERVTIEVKKQPGNRKRGYTNDEAKLILTAARQEANPVLRWVPWLCAFTGARVAEVCQLRREDVISLDGVHCLRITAEAGPIKTVTSERVVPVHSALVDEGFLEFAARIKVGPLFKQLTPDKFGSRGGNGTKMVGRWIRSLGISDPRISPSHSWRHRMKTLMRVHEVRPDIGDALVGHGRRTVGDGYGEFPVAALARELAKLPGPASSSGS